MLAACKEIWWSAFCTVGDVVVLHVDLREEAAREAEALAWLDEVERERCGRFLYDGPKRRFALCRAALRAVLCERLGCRKEQLRFGSNEFGKPFALLRGEMAPVSFNVSHSGDHGLIAYASQGWLGVDVEERVPRKNLEGLIESVLGESERAELAPADGNDRLHGFMKLWTIKEALVKAVGLGMSINMLDLEVPRAMRQGEKGGIFELPQTPGMIWRLQDLGTESFAAALAHEVSSS